MELGVIPPVLQPPSNVPTEQTKKEMADYTPAQRNIHLYERTIADLMKSRDDFKARVTSLECKMDIDLPYAVQLQDLKGKYCEATIQHVVTTISAGAGAWGMAVFNRASEATPFWCSATVAGSAVILGLATKPLSWAVRLWHNRKKK